MVPGWVEFWGPSPAGNCQVVLTQGVALARAPWFFDPSLVLMDSPWGAWITMREHYAV